MFLVQLIFAVLLAMLFSLVFAIGLRRCGPWGNLFIFFSVVFLATWAATFWVAPVGPIAFGIAWLPLVVVAMLFSLALAAFAPRNRDIPPRDPDALPESRDDIEQREVIGHTLDAFFWILAGMLVLLILLGIFMASPRA